MTLPPPPSDPETPQDSESAAQPLAAPQYGAPQYGAPAYPEQQRTAPQYAAPQYAAPSYPVTLTPGPGEPFDGATDPTDLARPLYGATFGQSISRFFRSYVRFTGRASRSEYWFSVLFTTLVTLAPALIMAIGAIMAAVSTEQYRYSGSYTEPAPGTSYMQTDGFFDSAPAAVLFFGGFILCMLVSLALFIPSLAITWRRLHDGNFAGPLWFLSLIPYGSIAVLVLTLLRSKPEGRRFDERHYPGA